MLGRQLLGQDAARELGFHLMRHHRLDERARRVPDAPILFGQAVHPYLHVLTERSVYASVP
jgi:hypothetical protein